MFLSNHVGEGEELTPRASPGGAWGLSGDFSHPYNHETSGSLHGTLVMTPDVNQIYMHLYIYIYVFRHSLSRAS